MYYLQLVDFKGKDKNAPIREHLLLRPIRDGQLKDNRGILLTFVEQNSNNKSRGSQWALESLPDFDPTTSKDYIGYKNIGLVPNIERFMDLAVFVPVPLDGTPVDPTTNTIPLSSFQAWSAIVLWRPGCETFDSPASIIVKLGWNQLKKYMTSCFYTLHLLIDIIFYEFSFVIYYVLFLLLFIC